MVTDRKSWQIDKHIPVAVIVGLGLQFMGFVWYAAKVDTVVNQVPAIDQRVQLIERTQFTEKNALILKEAIIANIKMEMTTLVEKVNRNTYEIETLKEKVKK